MKNGKRFEISYAQGITGDAGARRNLISNATQLIRASRGRGLIISSEARGAVGCRGPWDAVNLAAVWGLGQERGFEAMGKECRGVVVTAKLKRTSYRGVVDVVYGGEKPVVEEKDKAKEVVQGKGKQSVNGQKRKADVLEKGVEKDQAGDVEKPLSKRQMKKQAKEARLKGIHGDGLTESGSGEASSKEISNASGQ